MATIGIHVIWTTYGTWLPGDPRGHWSSLMDLHGNIIQPGGQLNRSDAATHRVAQERMKEPAKILTADEIDVVANTIGDWVASPKIAPALAGSESPALAGAILEPRVYAAAIEPTHVHLLLGPVQEPIGRCVGRLKGTTSSALKSLAINAQRDRTWTTGYWKVFVFDLDVLHKVKIYIENHNVRRGLRSTPYRWIWLI